MQWNEGYDQKSPFHEGGKVGRSDATPLKILPNFSKNVPVTRKKLYLVKAKHIFLSQDTKSSFRFDVGDILIVSRLEHIGIFS